MKLVIATLVFALVAVSGGAARAECDCVAVAGDVSAEVQSMTARADGLYVRGDYDGALKIYADAYAGSMDTPLLYAQAMCQWQLGELGDAEALFAAYLDAGGKLAFRDRAEAALADVRAGAGAGVVGGVVGGIGGGVEGTVDGGGAVGGGVVGGLRGVAAKPKKVAKGAAILLGVVAVVAVVAVAIHGITAAVKDDIGDDVTFDKKFGIGMGLTGVVVGATAFYLYGLTAASAAVGAACVGTITKPAVAPVVYASTDGGFGGGGLSAAGAF